MFSGASTSQKIVSGVLLIALATTLTLPGRQTVPFINAVSSFTQGTLGTAMGTRK